MDRSVSEETIPPAKKFKQAKLSFIKTLPSETKAVNKLNTQSLRNKRKTSGGSDSPNKVAKIKKTILATSAAESPNANLSKSLKVAAPKLEEGNDYEVSSSSEADTNGKPTGKCCLMDRFVHKLPLDAHQEISSTNETIDLTVDSTVVDNDKTPNIKSVSLKVDMDSINKSINDQLILIDDDSSSREGGLSPCESSSNIKHENKDGEKPSRCEDKCSEEKMKGNSNPVVTIDDKDDETEFKSSEENISEKTEACELEIISSSKRCVVEIEKMKDLSIELQLNKENNSLSHTGLEDSSENSEMSTSASTPKDKSETPKTSGKKSKVNSAKKSEREALKQKQKEEKEMERLERKQKLDEEKAEKEKIKKESREKQKDKIEKERLEKLKVKEEERLKREEEKLKREEERKKKQAVLETKQEEKRKKEEEKRQKDEDKQKEEEEKRKKNEKRKQAFQSFFIKPKDTDVKAAAPKPVSGGSFIPFELKKDMYLAPTVRRDAMTPDKKTLLDQILMKTKHKSSYDYLRELQSREIKPQRTGKVLRKNPQPEEDVEIIHDEEALKKVFHVVKLMQFHTDHRPPYYGTWQKRPYLNPRNPWGKDESMFDYDVDSDEEWEEEEPGESLSCSEGEEEKAEDVVEEEEEDGWMVPHGYLSEDEGCNDDDEITPEKLKLQQQAKAKAWEEEYKRKLQAAPVIAVGCFFEHLPSPVISGDVRLLYEFKAEVLCPTVPIPTTLFSLPEEDELVAENGTITPPVKGFTKKAVPDEAMGDLIRLVHGNTFGIKKLILEFRVFWLQKHATDTSATGTQMKQENLNGSIGDSDISSLNESVADTSTNINEDDIPVDVSEEKTKKDDGYGCSISKRQLELKIMAIAVRERRPENIKICWYVHEKVLLAHEMSDISLLNTWSYFSSVPAGKSVTPSTKLSCTKTEGAYDEDIDKDKTPLKPLTPRDQKSIIEFAVTREELEKRVKLLPVKDDTPTCCQSNRTDPSNQKENTRKSGGKESPVTKESNTTPKGKGEKTTPKGKLKNTPKAPRNFVMDLFIKKGLPNTKTPVSQCNKKNLETDDSNIDMIDEGVWKNGLAAKNKAKTINGNEFTKAEKEENPYQCNADKVNGKKKNNVNEMSTGQRPQISGNNYLKENAPTTELCCTTDVEMENDEKPDGDPKTQISGNKKTTILSTGNNLKLPENDPNVIVID